ncbi:MAG: hypothetical protein ACQXXL_03460 [Candidatus Methanosuratincola sp.]
MVNIGAKKLHTQRKTQRSTTHVRVKWPVKFQLERWMRKHRVKTYSQAISKLLEGAG